MAVSKQTLWFGWFHQSLRPPLEAVVMRDPHDSTRQKNKSAAKKKSTASKSRKR